MYSDRKKSESFLNEKNLKLTEPANAFKCYGSTYNVVILKSFNPELTLKKTEPTIKNKVKKLLSESIGFNFVTTLVLVLKKIESEDKTKYDLFYSHSKVETIVNESDFDNNSFKAICTTIISNI